MSILMSFAISFVILKSHTEEQNNIEIQGLTDALMSSLDYALSHEEVQSYDIPRILNGKILEIADISKHDVFIYDMQGNFLISNKDPAQVVLKRLPNTIINSLRKSQKRLDVIEYDAAMKSNVTSSYLILKNNMLEPIGVVYFPYYHSDEGYRRLFQKYIWYIVFANLFLISLSVGLGWIISSRLSRTLRKFSSLITKLAVFEGEPQLIKNYKNNDLDALVQAYNQLVLTIQDQKDKLTYKAREGAWRDMARQVAHEVKNPLTPMKLRIQKFQHKFDINDPEITQKTQDLMKMLISQIDVISQVAGEFSRFVQLPEKKNNLLHINAEVKTVIQVFELDDIEYTENDPNIMMNMDKIYLSRILTNIITNSKQAEDEHRKLFIKIHLEKINKKIRLTIQDNGVGIPPERLPRIFEPNFTSKGNGMGLGLTMVKKMIEDYGGEILVESIVGEGTTFIINLPIQNLPDVQDAEIQYYTE